MFMPAHLKQIRILLVGLLAALSALTLLPARAEAQQKSPQEIDRQVEAMLSKLTLEQKIELIHGDKGMFNPPMPQFGLPGLKCLGRADGSQELGA